MFKVFLLGAHFLGQVVKKGKIWTPSQKPIFADNWQVFLYFGFVLVSSSFFSFWCLFYFDFCFCFSFCLVFLRGFKGQVRWPKGPPHLALNPPHFLVVFLSFFDLLSKNCFLPKRHCSFVLSVSLYFPSILFIFPFSLSLSVSLSCYFLASFLLFFLVCFILLHCRCLFLSLHFVFASVSFKEQHQNIKL